MPYFPSKPPPTTTDDGTALGFYLEEELSRLASSLLDDVQAVEVRPAHVAPLRPREGMVVYADGTDWNPGSGEGLYTYGSDAAWHFVTNLPVPLSVANGGTGDTGSAWTAYTPTLTALAGAYTTASASGRYKTLGKTVFVNVDVSITTVGTGTFPVITLPITPLAIGEVTLDGWESQTTGYIVQARQTGATTLYIARWDNTNIAANNTIFRLTGVYEAA